MLKAKEIINLDAISYSAKLGVFTIRDSNMSTHVVRLFPKESCSCLLKKDCQHIAALKTSLGMKVTAAQLKTTYNLAVLSSGSRPHRQKPGRKKPRLGENTGQPGRNNPLSRFQTHKRDGTVPCFQRENTGQPGRDNPMSNIFRHTTGMGLSCVFNEKTRDSRDGTIQCVVFSNTQPGRDCPVFSTRKHGTVETGQCPVFSNRQPRRDSTVPCFQQINTGQPGRDNPMARIFRHAAGTGLSRVYNQKTRDSPDGMELFACPVPFRRPGF